jgi:hypothetical protein
MSDRIDQFLHNGKNELQEFAVTFARMIASLAVDPHGYFEKKYAARIEGAQSEQEIHSILTQLVQWATSSALETAEREKLDNELDNRGMPTTEELRAHFLQ